MIKAYIQQVHPNAGKMVLQALIPFRNLRESVLFTCKANPNSHYGGDKKVIAKANYDYYQRRIEPSRIASIEKYIRESIISEKLGYSVTALFPSSFMIHSFLIPTLALIDIQIDIIQSFLHTIHLLSRYPFGYWSV